MEKSGWKSDFANLKETLDKTYGVPDKNFMEFGQITKGQDFYTAFGQFRDFIAKQEGGKIMEMGTLVLPKDKPPPQILIFYTGHGAVNLEEEPRKPEDYKYQHSDQIPAAGQSGVSYWATGFGESQLRAQLSPMYFPSNTGILVVINSCYSGNNAD